MIWNKSCRRPIATGVQHADIFHRDSTVSKRHLPETIASFQIGGGIVLAAASAIFAAASHFGWDPYFAGVGFVATLAAVATLLAALGPTTSTSQSDAYQAAE
jgi:hypothetical protein